MTGQVECKQVVKSMQLPSISEMAVMITLGAAIGVPLQTPA